MARTKSVQMMVDHLQRLTLEENSNPSAEVHFELLQTLDQLRLAIETPEETILRLIYQPPQNAALRTVMDLGIFQILTDKAHRMQGVSALQITEYTAADEALIVRLMRLMASLGLCTTVAPGVFRANEKTAALTRSIAKDGIPCIYDLTVPTLSRLPEYLQSHLYRNPEDYAHSPMRWAVGQSQFEWLATHRDQQARFNSYMASRRQGRPTWFDTYPVSRLLNAKQPLDKSVLIVDIGGNQGYDLAQFRKAYPHLRGRLVLQDLPDVVKQTPCSEPSIEVVSYSFLDKQPVRGARAYYFRAIFHDWPDHICQQILRNTMAAMIPGESRILIVDCVLPDIDTPLLQASLDIQMMSIGAGIERSEGQWRRLLQTVGLEITGIWNHSPGMESVIEAMHIGSQSD
ncbi:Demethylsterigmatocystin 6-O-methyltransferase [Penicillium ucsense]|uniref:Demethylsterigmatocystin 6-O-methyltransferase n=1 Tax=Penicillium ucsense TaxID=2839758 RepID=A0A8J8W8X0_9EURO|nr:Demethylsterigmatocystin 6-O-methyltransferase [Penicillium ucsense]KAF7733761.1 Demethylsterigmatocystin 6-O-methyltransferase [Penicillium ucsense]